MTLTVKTLLEIAMANPINAEITARLPALGVDQCMLTAGCLFQAVWNHQSNRPVAQDVKDYDVLLRYGPVLRSRGQGHTRGRATV